MCSSQRLETLFLGNHQSPKKSLANSNSWVFDQPSLARDASSDEESLVLCHWESAVDLFLEALSLAHQPPLRHETHDAIAAHSHALSAMLVPSRVIRGSGSWQRDNSTNSKTQHGLLCSSASCHSSKETFWGSTFGTLEPPFAETAIICTQPSCAHRGRTKTHTKQTHTQHTKYKTIPHTTKRTTAINTRPQRSEKKPWPHHGDLTSTPRWPEVSGSSRSVPCPGAANQNRYTTRGGPVDGLWSQGERRERVHVHVGRFSR